MFHRAWRYPTTRSRRVDAWGRYMVWRIHSWMSPGPKVIPFVNGTLLVGDPSVPEVGELFLLTLNDFEAMCFVAHFLCAEEYFVDVGARIGSYTVLAAGSSGAYVTAFESSLDGSPLLRINAALNELDAYVDCRSLVLGETGAHSRIIMAPGSDQMVGGLGGPRCWTEANGARLDDASLAGRPALIKIDADGDELSVLRGAHGTLAHPSLSALVVACDPLRNQAMRRLHLVEAVLERHGFTEVDYDPFKRLLMRPEVSRRKRIYIRKSRLEHVIRRLVDAAGVWVTEDLCI